MKLLTNCSFSLLILTEITADNAGCRRKSPELALYVLILGTHLVQFFCDLLNSLRTFLCHSVCQACETENGENGGIAFTGKKLLSKDDFSQKMYSDDVQVTDSMLFILFSECSVILEDILSCQYR